MSSTNPPKLRPVSSPVDPYETAGVAQPSAPVGGANFEALSRLSTTLNNFGIALDRNKRQAEEDARKDAADHAEENAAKIVNLPDKQLLGVLNLKDKDQVEAARALTAAGYKGADHPIGVRGLMKAAALDQVRRLDYPGRLREPEFFQRNANTELLQGPEKADEEMAKLREEVLESLGTLGPSARSTIEAELVLQENAYRKDRMAHRNRLYTQQTERKFALAVQRPISLAMHARVTGNSESFKESMDAIKDMIREETLTTGNRDSVIDALKRHTEAALMNLVATEKDGVLHSADAMEEELNMPELIPFFVQLDTKLQSSVNRQDDYDSKDVPEAKSDAITALETALSEQFMDGKLLSPGEVQAFIFGPKGTEIIQKAIGPHGVPFSQAGVIRGSLMSRWSSVDRESRSDDAQAEIQAAAFDGFTDKARVLLNAYSKQFTPQTRASMMNFIIAQESRASSDTRKNAVRRKGFEDLWKGLGTLPPEAFTLKAGAMAAFDGAYRAAEDENPEDTIGAYRAGQAAFQSSSEYTQIIEAQRLVGGARITVSPLFDRQVMKPIADRLEAGLRRTENEESRVRTEQEVTRNSEILQAFRTEMSGIYEELSRTPEVLKKKTQDERNMEILSKMGARSGKILKDIIGLAPGSKKTVAASVRNNDTQIARFTTAELGTDEVKRLTGRGSNKDDFFWAWSDGHLTRSMGRFEEFLTTVIDGGDKPFSTGPEVLVQSKALEFAPEVIMAMSARLVDNYDPISREEAGSTRIGDLAYAVRGSGEKAREEARNALRSAVYVAGMTPQEVIKGMLRTGVPLSELWGNKQNGVTWTQAIPVKSVSFYPTVHDAEQALSKSENQNDEAAQLMRALGLDSSNEESRKKFFGWQIDLARRRNLQHDELRKVRSYYKNIPFPRAGDANWLRRVKRRGRQE